MVILFVLFQLAGAIQPAGHCLEERSRVLTKEQAVLLSGQLAAARARAVKAEQLVRKYAPEQAHLLNEAAMAYDAGALCLDLKAPVCPSCNCSEWLAGGAGAAVGAVVCGGFWIGNRL